MYQPLENVYKYNIFITASNLCLFNYIVEVCADIYEAYYVMYLVSSTVCAFFGYFVEVFHVAAVQSQHSSEFSEQDARTGSDSRAGASYQGHFPLQR